MENLEYRTILNRRNVFRRKELEEIAQFISESIPEDAQAIRAILSASALPKPERHLGTSETDWFEVNMTKEITGRIQQELIVAEAAAVGFDGKTTRDASRIGTLVDRWGRQLQNR